MWWAYSQAAEEGHLAQRLLHHPLEVAVEETVDEEDVECSLVVGHKDIALLGVEILASLNVYGQEKEVAGDARPYLPGIVAPEVSVAQSASYDGHGGRDDAQDDEQWQDDEQLVETVEKSRDILHLLSCFELSCFVIICSFILRAASGGALWGSV